MSELWLEFLVELNWKDGFERTLVRVVAANRLGAIERAKSVIPKDLHDRIFFNALYEIEPVKVR